ASTVPFHVTPPTAIYTLSLHDALPILGSRLKRAREALGYTQKGIAEAVGSKLRSWQDYEAGKKVPGSQVIAGLVRLGVDANWLRSEEHTSELQSRENLVCRLLLEKKKT